MRSFLNKQTLVAALCFCFTDSFSAFADEVAVKAMTVHTVALGETLTGIAQNAGIDPAKLVAANEDILTEAYNNRCPVLSQNYRIRETGHYCSDALGNLTFAT